MAVIKIVPMPGAKGDKGDDGATGAQGPQGPIGATGPAGADAAWYYNGAYNPGASYVVGDVVTYDGQTWYRKNANGGNVGDTPSVGLFWDLIAAKGEQGLTGLEGEPGPQGPKGDSANPKLISYTASETSLDLSSYELNSLITIYRNPDYNSVQGTNFFIRALKTNGSNPVVGQAYLYGVVHDPNPGTDSITVAINKITNTFGDQNFDYFNFMTTGLPGEDGATGPQGEPGTPGTELNFWNFVGDPGLPTVDGALVVDGISGRSGGNAVVFGGPGGSVILAANNGEFLKDCNVSSNQIATVGNIEEIDTLSNGLVVTGQIDDPIINPAGTMSLSVQDGYTALIDVVAESAVFNGDVQITNLSGTRNTTIDTPTTINNEVNIQTEYGEGWTFNNDGYILGPWLSSAEDPANTGRYIRLNGITRADNNPLLISSSGPVLINGTGGEFLNSHGDPNNQIATIGDIENAISQSGSLTYKSGAVPATHHGVAGDTKNDIKYDDTHMYICVADYTDGSAAIWKRINWASGNW